MSSLVCPLSLVRFIFLALIYSALLGSLCSTKPLCHHEELDALVHFNQSTLVAEFASPSPFSYSKVKVASWVNGDCCLWDGIECDKKTGHVIGLDLSSSYLYGSINASSGLFRLAHLKRLNLAFNHFKNSQIPSKVGSFSELILLNLSSSVFYGSIPPEITKLSTLTTLDLGSNWLELKRADFVGLIKNMTSLEKLDLENVSISSTLPNIVGNLTSLTFLNLFTCNLTGKVPPSMSNLVKLTYLDLGVNSLLGPTSSFLRNLTNLNYLSLGANNFLGSVPPFLGKLSQLQHLDLAQNNFSGNFPFWVGNLTQLNYIDLSDNNFSHGDLSWLGKQSKLAVLRLVNMNLGGEIPPSVCNMTHLQGIFLVENELTGHIPSCLSNLTELTSLSLTDNLLHGPIPNSIFKLANILILALGGNKLTGIVSFDSFSGLQQLEGLQLSDNGISLIGKGDNSSLFPNLSHLECCNCSLREFPYFLKHVDKLNYLDLRSNNIGGYIPMWIGNKNRKNLTCLKLQNNFLTGFEQASMFSFFTNLLFLYLSFNKIQGPYPILPSSIQVFEAKENLLTGELPASFCDLVSLVYVDLSDNNLSGPIPSCLGNLSSSLLGLNFANNSFNGNIPDNFSYTRSLRTMDLSSNQLIGSLPRTLVDCQMLELIDLSDNHIGGKLSSWLGELLNLEVLLLRSNHLSGEVEAFETPNGFPKLRILDLSRNNLTGVIPNNFFSKLRNMKSISINHFEYMVVESAENTNTYSLLIWYNSELVLANKGAYLKYWKIPNVIAAIDLSSNRFYGDIPLSLGSLKMVNVLNLSNNHLSGEIPDALANLTRLESLDLSGNMLRGEIPQKLSQLTTLESFNVSHNQLVGPIPQGKQFNTFGNTSYEGNLGLCGFPLTNMCGDPDASSPPQAVLNGDGSMDWEIVLIGYGCGLVVGLVAGNWIATTKLEWFMKTFRIRQRQPRRASRIRRGRRTV